jgi:hypothetical protein
MENINLFSAIFGISSCIACLILTLFILFYGSIIINEPNVSILIFELLVAFIGTIVNSYVFYKYLNESI